ncbi:MAG: energy transducer TonB [Sphingomicrobium sp.]
MSSYLGTADRPEKLKAAVAVIAVHAALAAVILTGLNVETVQRAVETMTTIAVFEPEPPPPPPPPQVTRPNPAPAEAGAPGRKAELTPVVAPLPRIPVQSPIAAATVAGQGSATTAGTAASSSGTGAGGSGAGRGGGGAGFAPARWISKIPDREYQRLAATGIASGSVAVTIKVNEDGSASNCRVARSSGDRRIDALICQLTLRHVRFEPARDPRGRPIAQDVTFVPNWWRP